MMEDHRGNLPLPPPPVMRQLWKTSDLCEYFQMERSMVRKLREQHGLPHYRFGDKAIRYDPTTTISWVASLTRVERQGMGVVNIRKGADAPLRRLKP